MQRCGCASYRFLDLVLLPLLSQRYSTARASAKRYDNRYEEEGSERLCRLRNYLSLAVLEPVARVVNEVVNRQLIVW